MLQTNAAAMIPALTGYIDKAKQKTAVSETRSVVMAAQTVASEKYAKAGNGGSELADTDKTAILKLADLSSVSADKITTLTSVKGKVTKVVYETTNGYVVTYENGVFSDPTEATSSSSSSKT